MFRASRMKRVDILVLERDVDAVVAEMGRQGLVHLEQARLEGSEDLLRPAEQAASEVDRRAALAARVEALALRLGVTAEDAGQEPPGADWPLEAMEGRVTILERAVDALTLSREKAADERSRLRRLAEQVEPFESLRLPLSEIEELDFLHVALGSVPEDQVGRLNREVREDVVLVPVGGPRDERQFILAVSSKKGRWALQSALDQSHFIAEPVPGAAAGPAAAAPAGADGQAPAEMLRAVRERLRGVERDLAAAEAELRETGRQNAALLAAFARQLEVERRVLQAKALFGRTATAYLITGWAPAARVAVLERGVARAAEGRTVFEVRDPADLGPLAEDPPVEFSNGRLFRPFQVLVSGYGTPTYTEIEPTPFVAVTYLLMFGLMFGDVGQGAVLGLVGWWLSRRGGSRSLRDIGGVMAWAGLSAMFFGGIYNSVFGKDGVLPWRAVLAPLGESRQMQVLLGATVGFGVLVITLGTALNVINRLQRRDFLRGVLDRFGLVGMVIYWGAIGLMLRALVFGAPIRAWQVGAFLILPLVLLFFKEPIYALLTHKRKVYHDGVFNGLMEAGVELLETFSAFLANTLSFLRVGAFALAHAGLCVGIFEIGRVVRGSGGVGRTVGAILAVAVGNAIVIALEGLVVGIQAVRLEYYEFFSRFFRGTGRRYLPFQIEARAPRGAHREKA